MMVIIILKNMERIYIKGDLVRISIDENGMPKSLTVLREGYTRGEFFVDVISGWAIVGDEDEDEDEEDEE